MDCVLKKCELAKQFSVDSRGEKITFLSPCCFLHTIAGTVPHLTNETLGYLDQSLLPTVSVVPLPQIARHEEVFRAFSGSLSELFVQRTKTMTYLSVQDSSSIPKMGHNTKHSVAVWDNGGKINVTPESYMKVVETVEPLFYESLADGDVGKSSSKKRLGKAVDRSSLFLQECVKLKQSSKTQIKSNMLCLLQGGYSKEEWLRCIRLTLKSTEESEVWGFVLDSLPKEPVVSEELKSLVFAICDALPHDKPIAVYKHGHPLSIIDLIECGVSIFDTSYVTSVTKQNGAFVFKIPKTHSTSKSNVNIAECANVMDAHGFIEKEDMTNEGHAQSFSPILKTCCCYTCANHTRAYIHHLINVNEMLAPVLLMIHNLHHYLSFFESLKDIETLEELKLFRNMLLALNCNCTE